MAEGACSGSETMADRLCFINTLCASAVDADTAFLHSEHAGRLQAFPCPDGVSTLNPYCAVQRVVHFTASSFKNSKWSEQLRGNSVCFVYLQNNCALIKMEWKKDRITKSKRFTCSKSILNNKRFSYCAFIAP